MLLQFQGVKPAATHFIAFTKSELNAVLALYSYQVSKGAWRDYAVDFTRTMAVFSMFRHTAEQPLVSVVKMPANTSTGYIFEIFFEQKRLSRTPDLDKALGALRENLT